MKNKPLLKLSILERPLLGSLTLRAKLILGTMLITLIAIAGMGYYVYSRAQQANAYLTNQLDQSVLQQAEDKLNTTSTEQATALNDFFASMRRDITTVGTTTENLLSQEALLNNGVYWDAFQSLARLPNRSWDNSNAELGSVFIPANIELTNKLVSELNTAKQLDFIIPTFLQANPDIVAIYFGGITGETLYYPNIDLASIVPPDFDVTGRPWFVKAAPAQNPEHNATWSDPYLDAALHGLVITSSIPVYDSAGKFRGVAAMDIQLNRITAIVSNVRVGETGYAFLIDKDGRLIAMPEAAYKDFGITPETLPLGEIFDQTVITAKIPPEFFEVLPKIASGESGLETITLGGTQRFIVYRPLPEVGYGLAIVVPSEELLAAAITAKEQIAQVTRNTITQSIFLVAGILAIALIATLGIGNGLTLPLRALTRTAQEITGGNLDAEARVQGQDEIGTLAKTLNTMTSNLRELIQSLEQRVAERTSALEAASKRAERRAAQFEAIALVVGAINSIRRTEELLPRIASVISEQFGYYHVGIFLNDESNEFTILSAANSEGGQQMLARGHRLKIGEQGIVGYVTETSNPRVARNVGEDSVYFKNPDLPETRSEMALPLRIGGQVVGALDVQSTQTDAFSEEDVAVLSILADQVSLAIDNARLFDTTRRSLAEAEALYRQYLREAWSRLPSEQNLTGFRYSVTGAAPLEAPIDLSVEPEDSREGQKDFATPLSVPIVLRGETLGHLIVQAPRDRPWSQEQIDLVQAVAERVALSAENARLFEETSRRAERERMVAEITSKVRSTNDPELMVQTALNELRSALGASEVQLIPHILAQPQNEPMRGIPAVSEESPKAKSRRATNGGKK